MVPALEQLFVDPLSLGVLHLGLELITELLVELVDVLLLISFVVVPAKSFKELEGPHVWLFSLL